MKCSNPSIPNPTKPTNAMEGYERKNKEEIHKELQDLDPIGSPQLEEKVIGGNVDLDLLSFPSKKCKKHGGKGGGRASFQDQQWRREKPKNVVGSRRKKGYL
jgi:hypothetical protein